jgi:hypothetical protein
MNRYFTGRRLQVNRNTSIAVAVLMIWVALLLAGCQSGGNPPPTPGTPTFPPGTSTISLPNTPVRPGGLCVPGAFDLTAQSTTFTSAITFDAGGIIDRIGLSVTGGSYTGTVAAVNPINCSPLPEAPPVGTLVVTYALEYLGDFSRGQTICMNASRTDFTSFDITGLPVIDDLIAEAVRGNIHLAIDTEVADRMNRLLNGSPLPPTANPRCSNWIDLAAP